MGLTLFDILQRSKKGPIIEEKQFDMSIFKKTQDLQKKYNIKYDPENPLDKTGEMADRVYQAGRELFLDIGAYSTTTRRAIKVTEKELDDEIAACPRSNSNGAGSGQGQDGSSFCGRDEYPVVIAGIQTTPYSDETMMHTIYRLCAEERSVDGIWGGILLKIDGSMK